MGTFVNGDDLAVIDSIRRSSPLFWLACFLCSILSGDLLVEPGEFSLHQVQPVIEAHQPVYVQSTSGASVEIPMAKERRREAYNKQAGLLKLAESPKKDHLLAQKLTTPPSFFQNVRRKVYHLIPHTVFSSRPHISQSQRTR
jgi:hypothetical protein